MTVDDTNTSGTYGSEGREQIELVERDEDTMTLRFDLGSGVTVSVTPVKGGFDLILSSHEKRYKETVARDFYTSQQKRGRIGNTAASQIGQDPSWLKQRLKELGELLEEAKEDLETGLTTSAAQSVMERTEQVLAFDEGEGATFKVRLSPPEESQVNSPRWFTFDSASEWLNLTGSTLNEMHYGQFFTHAIVCEDDLETVRDYWEDQLERVPGAEPKDARVTQKVLDALQARLPGRVYTSSDPLGKDELNALWEPEGQHDLEYDGDVVWVQTSGIEQLIDSNTSESGTGNANMVVRLLRRRDIVVGDKMRRRAGSASKRRTVWPVAADELGIAPETDVVRDGDSPEDEIAGP